MTAEQVEPGSGAGDRAGVRAGARRPRTRLAPAERRVQLIELGTQLLATRSLDELTVDLLVEEAGISRGLLYHYFEGLHGYHLAVVRAAVDDLVAVTAPRESDDVVEVLTGSLEAYVDYVLDNLTGYRSLVRAAGGNDELRAIYDEARRALTDRIFDRIGPDGLTALGYEDTPAVRMMVRGWSALAENVVLAWVEDPHGMAKKDLLDALAGSLFGIVAATSA